MKFFTYLQQDFLTFSGRVNRIHYLYVNIIFYLFVISLHRFLVLNKQNHIRIVIDATYCKVFILLIFTSLIHTRNKTKNKISVVDNFFIFFIKVVYFLWLRLYILHCRYYMDIIVFSLFFNQVYYDFY